ncbi:MAG: phosphoenolpyruvate synthase [Candidatus Paceibacterota bacterium]|jgi:pyruvate,water dikinase
MKYIKRFKETTIQDVPSVGGKNASLGEMIRFLVPQGVNIPDGFATTAEAYFYFLEKTGIKEKIKNVLSDLDVSDMENLQQRGRAVRNLILKAELPDDFKNEIVKYYRELSQEYGVKNLDVAVRSSATAEDLPNASFAGQQETFLNTVGEKKLLEAVRKCFASLFTDRAIVYREQMKFDHLKIALSVGVQKMVRSDLGASGVMFSCDTESGFADVVLINASYGLGENVVLGRVEPDQYYIFEKTLETGFKPILEKKIGAKMMKLVYSKSLKKSTKNIPVSEKDRNNFVLNDEEILQLARWSMLVEKHYQKPMDMEWAKDGRDGTLFIVQARPETVQSRRDVNVLEAYKLKTKGIELKTLLTGLSIGSKIGQGKVNRIMDAKNINKFKKGEVLVTDMTDPDWVPAMKIASAIITDSGGRTAHAAIVSRELGIPCVVGTGRATKVLKAGQEITVSCAEGEEGKVYEGIIPFEVEKTNISNIGRLPVKVMMNLGEPDQAFGLSFIPNDGVGLAREEFIIVNSIKIHPQALIDYKKLPTELRNKIDKLTLGYENKAQFFVDKLAQGIGKIGAAFYPKEVIVRFSDFKTNEYRSLIGGELYEPKEENPMIGWRGASRYYDPKFASAFALECQAIKKVREEFGLDNVVVMVPFCRTIEEAEKVIKEIEKNGLKVDPRSKMQDARCKVYVMCEIPSNVILADEFLEIFDGMSIGSNDLTQLTLGLDRDAGILAHIGNEKNEAVKILISQIIKKCKEKGKYIGICGQGPSDFPDFAEFLMNEGIESMSLNPDSILKTIEKLAKK